MDSPDTYITKVRTNTARNPETKKFTKGPHKTVVYKDAPPAAQIPTGSGLLNKAAEALKNKKATP